MIIIKRPMRIQKFDWHNLWVWIHWIFYLNVE